MAVRSVMNRYNCALVHAKCVLNKSVFNVCPETYVRTVNYCRIHIHSQCSNEYKHFVSLTVPVRRLAQDVSERISDVSETKQATENCISNAEKIKKKENEQIVTLDYHKGLPRITVPLPSRKEKCRFTLKPVSNTVGDLTSMIMAEDRGVDRITLSSKDGVKIASSSSIEILLEEDEFYITINDTRYRVVIPPMTKLTSFTKDDIEKLSDVRLLVSQLYETLNVKEYHAHKERELRTKLEQLQISLEPLEQQRMQLEKRAEFRTSVLTWVGLGMMGVQFGILARLTWWEYSWDIMEPVTYFVTYGTAMAMYAYFAITKQDYVLPDVRDRQHLLTLHKKARKMGFDLCQYNTLKEQLANVKQDLERLHDPLRPPLNSPSTFSFSNSSSIICGSQSMDSSISSSLLQNVKEYITFLIKKMKKS